MHDVPNLSRMSDLIGRIYAASVDPQLWQSFLESLAQSFGSDQALLLSVDNKFTPGGLTVTTGMDMEIVNQWEGSKEHVDPWFQACQKIKNNITYLGPDLCSNSTLHKSAFYADSLKTLDIEYTLGGIAVESEVRNWIFSIFSSKHAGEFTGEQKALFQLLVPHIGRAMLISRQLEHSRNMEKTLTTALDLSRYGVVILDEDQNLVWLNKKADSVFTDCDGITIHYNKLSLWDYSDQKAFNHALHRPVTTDGHIHKGTEQFVLVRRPSCRKPYQILACPLNGMLDAPFAAAQPGWLILIHDTEERKKLTVESVRATYGLTPAEGLLCATLHDVCSLSEAIDKLKVSRNTAKTHLKRIFEKVGVSSQTELVLTLSAGFDLPASNISTADPS